jgi:hypothetical protein
MSVSLQASQGKVSVKQVPLLGLAMPIHPTSRESKLKPMQNSLKI